MKINKNGISLIVLVITIIVLAILAATVIISITNSGLINSSKDATEDYTLAEVRDMAALAWNEALVEYSDQTSITDVTYQTYVESYLTNNGIDISKYTIVADANGIHVNEKKEEQEEEEPTAPSVTIITFTFIAGDYNKTFSAEEGMSWETWATTSYAAESNLDVIEGGIVEYNGEAIETESGEPVYSNSPIEDGGIYRANGSGGSEDFF